ncbi:MAG: type II toxin-antitoxin system VapC family toxin [Deltaproteobacteria bacterium]|nr:type II toxin-antitoxin system VapC family toxin [Deltaproteobacteria bacterium]
MRILLDTNAYSALMRGHAGVADRVRGAEEVVVSAVVAGELMLGFRSGGRFEKNLAELTRFLGNPLVTFLPVGLMTARRFAEVGAGLRARGRPIPTNDIWIAAHAMECGAELLSFDDHFGAVDGLLWTRLPSG